MKFYVKYKPILRNKMYKHATLHNVQYTVFFNSKGNLKYYSRMIFNAMRPSRERSSSVFEEEYENSDFHTDIDVKFINYRQFVIETSSKNYNENIIAAKNPRCLVEVSFVMTQGCL